MLGRRVGGNLRTTHALETKTMCTHRADLVVDVVGVEAGDEGLDELLADGNARKEGLGVVCRSLKQFNSEYVCK